MNEKSHYNPFAESYRAKNKKVHAMAKDKALKMKIGNGNSHHSGKTYKHE